MAKTAPAKTSKKSSKKSSRQSSQGSDQKTTRTRAASGTRAITSSAAAELDKKVAALNDWRGARLAEIRDLIREVDPKVVEEWKWMGTPVWSNAGMYVLANAHKDKVKITFCHGAKLADPQHLFNAGLGGNKWRAIDLSEDDAIEKRAFKALLRAAITFNQENAGSMSKRSRTQLVREKPSDSDDLEAHEATLPVKPTRSRPKGVAAASPGNSKQEAEPKRTKPQPKLLSGDNPQIAKGDGDGPVQDYIAAIPGWKREVARRLDDLIVQTVKPVKKAVKWNSPFYGIEDQGWFLNFHCFSKYVKVAFFRGSSLKPLPPGESKQAEVRYFDIRENDPVNEKQLASWILQASKMPGWKP